MNATVKFLPGDHSTCVQICLTLDQLKEEAKGFIATLIAARIDPVGLRDQDFIWVVLRRRMESLMMAAQRMGLNFIAAPSMDAGCDLTDISIEPFGDEGPFILFYCGTQDDAVLFRSLVL